MDNNAIILAAGKGTRMKSNLYKVLHPVLGKPMIKHVIDHLNEANVQRKIVVVSEDADTVKEIFKNEVEFVVQAKQLGTGHAAMMAEPLLANIEGTTLVICGDTPLITSDTINNLLKLHNDSKSDATILTTLLDNPTGYGRVIRESDNSILKIVEQKDANKEELLVNEINVATYCFDNKLLFNALNKITNLNAQSEYYLTDVIEIIKKNGGKVSAYIAENSNEIIGINDRVALSKANQILKERINERLMRSGVSIIDPQNTLISEDTIIGKDTIIYPGTIMYGKNTIGRNCIVGPNTELMNVVVGDKVNIKQSVISDSVIGNNTTVGPFAHFRNHAVIGDHVRIGNFVEIKKSKFGNNSNAAHLSYIGDADVGTNVNMGCGSITVNYDGKNKSKTTVGDNVFVGCNSNLIAPVSIGDGAYIAAGSTINKNVPNDSLAIAREKQINKLDYAKKFKK